MTPHKIPILTLRLLDVVLPDKPNSKVYHLGQAKDLIRDHKEQATAQGIDLMLFHNEAIVYSAIQLSSYQGKAEWTAVGTSAVQALRLWYQLYQQQNPASTQNVVEIIEQYTPSFIKKPQKYQINAFLVSDDLARHLNQIRSFQQRHERLQRYIYGNLQTFFQFIHFEYDPSDHYLDIQVLDSQRYPKALPIYHHQKKSALHIVFKCNFRLPQTIRIGQSTALGYGKIQYL